MSRPSFKLFFALLSSTCKQNTFRSIDRSTYDKWPLSKWKDKRNTIDTCLESGCQYNIIEKRTINISHPIIYVMFLHLFNHSPHPLYPSHMLCASVRWFLQCDDFLQYFPFFFYADGTGLVCFVSCNLSEVWTVSFYVWPTLIPHTRRVSKSWPRTVLSLCPRHPWSIMERGRDKIHPAEDPPGSRGQKQTRT